MTTKTHHFTPSTDAGQQLHYIVWQPTGAPRAVLQLVHGMEEYIDRYDVLARRLCDDGWAVIGHDHLGHGFSGTYDAVPSGSAPLPPLSSLSQRGFFTERADGADVVIADIHLIHLEARRRWSSVPMFIMGHSMGSFFLRRYLAVHPESAAGAIICGTGWYNALLTGSALLASQIVGRLCGWHTRSRFLKVLTSPHALAFRSEGRDAWLSRDAANVQRFHADALCGFGFTCGAYRVMYQNLLRVSLCRDYERLRVAPDGQFRGFPVLVISGAEDSVGGARAVRKVAAQYKALGFADVTQKAVAHDRHEVIFEPDGEAVRDYIAHWLGSRLEA